jgi:hypothetical protein
MKRGKRSARPHLVAVVRDPVFWIAVVWMLICVGGPVIAVAFLLFSKVPGGVVC